MQKNHIKGASQMSLEYDILRVNSRGAVVLPPKWVEKRLDLREGDMVLVEHTTNDQNESELRIVKFDPKKTKEYSPDSEKKQNTEFSIP